MREPDAGGLPLELGERSDRPDPGAGWPFRRHHLLLLVPALMFSDTVIGLARIMPRGDVSVVAAPYGAGDARGMTVLLVTHDNRILDRADRILTLEDGRILRDDRRARA